MAETRTQAEYELISTSLEVEQLDACVFRSKSLWLPRGARGVFGGQVISQAVVSASNSVQSEYGLHSLHCYFLLSASASRPILYYVERLREGRTYSTRSVLAVQDGKTIFIMMCSFQRPELHQPSHQFPMPSSDIPDPDGDELELAERVCERLSKSEDVSQKYREYMAEVAEEKSKSPMATKWLPDRTDSDGNFVAMCWIRARGIPKYEPAFQKCILAYMSDSGFIGVPCKALGLKFETEGPGSVAMNSQILHLTSSTSDEFHCGDWLLYVIVSPRAGSGRGIAHGRIYTRTGTLVAITAQEGVVRAGGIRPMQPPPPPPLIKQQKAKL